MDENWAESDVVNTLRYNEPKSAHLVVSNAYAFEPGIARRLGGHSRFTPEVSPTLRANAGDNQTAVAYSIDPYNGSMYDDVQSTLGVNCGMSTGRNGVMYRNVINSNGTGISPTIDASYYKGQGEREGCEREYIAVEKESVLVTGRGQQQFHE